MKDLKEALSSARKPDLTHVRRNFMAYTSRGNEYGSVRYERANYLRATGDGPHSIPTAADFERFRTYLRAAFSHIAYTLDALEEHIAYDPGLAHVVEMRTAAYAADTDVPPDGNVGASGLPHVAHACSSLMMAIEQAVRCGLLPADPGQPWTTTKRRGLTASELRLVETNEPAGELRIIAPNTRLKGDAFDDMIASELRQYQATAGLPFDTSDVKIAIDTSDPETKATYDAAVAAREAVAAWPAWKHGGTLGDNYDPVAELYAEPDPDEERRVAAERALAKLAADQRALSEEKRQRDAEVLERARQRTKSMTGVL